jgi:hypothetical protein
MPESVQRSSSPRGFQVTGSGSVAANVSALNSNASVMPKDTGTPSTTAVSGGKGGVQIQGNTRINATGASTNAVAVGQSNKAGNELGAIGGK